MRTRKNRKGEGPGRVKKEPQKLGGMIDREGRVNEYQRIRRALPLPPMSPNRFP